MNDKKDLAVTALLNALDHPLNGEIETVRGLILGASPQIREAVKWNAPRKNLRYITLRTPADAKTAAVKALVRQAFALVETST